MINLTPGYKSEPMNYLFGNILTVSEQDVWVILIFSLLILGIMLKYYRIFLAVSYDALFARARGIKVGIFQRGMILLIALGVLLIIKAIGLILLIALITIPPYIVEKYCDSLKKMMIWATSVHIIARIPPTIV